MLRIPAIDLALAAVEKPLQARKQIDLDHRVHRLQAFAVEGDLQRRLPQRVTVDESLRVVFHQQRAVAGQGEDEIGANRCHCCCKSGQRPLVIRELIADHRVAEALVVGVITIGIDNDVERLALKPLDEDGHQWLAIEVEQALVLAAHTSALTAGKNYRGDILLPGCSSLPGLSHRLNLARGVIDDACIGEK